MCNNGYTMGKHKRKQPATATDILRKTILESGMSFADMERRSDVKRQSLMKFARAEQSLRLDMVDKLLPVLGLQVVPSPDAKPPEPTPEKLAKRKAKRTRRPGSKGKTK